MISFNFRLYSNEPARFAAETERARASAAKEIIEEKNLHYSLAALVEWN